MAKTEESDGMDVTEEDEQGPAVDENLMYDPDQDLEERRKIRKGYRKLQEDEALQDPNSIGIELLTQKVKSADRLFERVRGPQEATLDSAFLLTASNLGAAKARQMRSDIGAFDIDDFVAKLITFMGGRRHAENVPAPTDIGSDGSFDVEDDGGGPLEWEKVGRKALAKSRRVPAMDFMLGPLSIEQKKRVVGKRARLEKEAEEERRPQELNEEDIQKSENETTKNVIALERLMRKIPPTNLFRIIINPHSFSQSVENMFYLSFLIRDGKVSLDIDEDTGEPIIQYTNPPEDLDWESGVKKKQMIMELDMATWERAIEVFNIADSIIPTRTATETNGTKWYG